MIYIAEPIGAAHLGALELVGKREEQALVVEVLLQSEIPIFDLSLAHHWH